MEGFCRSCLIKYDDPVELLEYTERNRRLYVYLTGIQVKRNDPMPFQVCKGCYMNMKLACRFKKQCRNSDKKFKRFLMQKEEEDLDFSTFLKNNDDSLLLRFPTIDGHSTPSVQRLKEDDNESTCTSIRNFITNLIHPDEIPDTEARIIKEVIEEEADILDDTLDSHWLQDDISIDADFRLDFSFSPFSTPRQGTSERFYSPYKPVDDNEQIKQLVKNEQQHTVTAVVKREPSDSDETDYETEQPQDKEAFIAAKRILLNSTSNINNNLENLRAVQSILVSNNNETDLKRLAEEIITKEEENLDPLEVPRSSFYVEKDIKDEDLTTEISAPLEKGDKIDRNLEKALQNESNKEFSLEAILGTPSDKVSDIVTAPCNDLILAEIGNKVKDLETLHKKDDLDTKPNEELVDGVSSKIEAFATPVYQGASGGCTPTIANILFGKKLDNENSNTVKSDIVPVLDKIESSICTDVLDDFFDKETGDYIGYKPEPLEEFKKLQIISVKKKEISPEIKDFGKLGKSRYDLSDFSCKICDKKYKDAKSLKIHFTKKHNFKIIGPRNLEGLVEMVCDYCGDTFDRRSLLRSHIRKHLRPRKVPENAVCTHCLLKFSSQSKLRMHMTTHIGKKALKPQDDKYVCPTCGHVSTTQSNLNVHMKRHTKLYSYRCEQCDKGYYRKTDFKTHMRIHTGENPFPCIICPKKFRRADTLNRHMKTHRADRKQTCQHCKKTFVTPHAFQNHLQNSKNCIAIRLHETLIGEHRRKGKPKRPPKLYIIDGVEDKKEDAVKEKNPLDQNDPLSQNEPSIQKDPSSQKNSLRQKDPLNQKDEVKEMDPLNEDPQLEEPDTEKIEITDLLDLNEEEEQEDIYEDYEVLEDDLDEDETFIDPMDIG